MSALRPALPGANLLLALRDPLELVSRMATVGDDVVSARIGPRTLYLLREPALIRQLLGYTGDALRKERALRLARLVLGEGLLTSEGERHREARRRLRPVFERQRLGGYGTVVLEQAGAVVGRWRDGERINPYEEMRRFALNATARALFGRTFDDATPAVVAAVEAGIRGFDRHRNPFAALLNRLPVPGTLRLRRARKTLLAATAELVDRGDGPLAVVLRAHPDRRQALDDALVILLAGHETTAVALAWCCLLVADHPAVERRLHEEVESVAEDGVLKADDCQRLRYTRQVVAEAMRLYPPVWAISREAVAPLEIGSHRFPRNAVLMVSPWALHRDPRFWPDPLRFDPDRFVDPHRIAPFTYVPFSGGVRGCIGEGVAWTEAVLALATVSHACRLERTSAAPVLVSASISLRPTLQLEVRRRTAVAPARSTIARPPSEAISITEVSGTAALRAFIDLPYRLYARDPNWVPPLRLGERRRWSARHNPTLRRRWTCRFLARRSGKVVGRIAAIEDAEFAARWAPGTGFFGFFETVDDEDVARALLIAAESALRERSASRILGPVNLSTHDEVGLLVDGFDRPPMILDPYNPPYYPALLRAAGYEEERGYQAHEWKPALVPSPLVRRALARASASGAGVRVRATARQRWNDDVTLLHGLYNACFADLWGFVPMRSEEMRARAAEFRPFYRPELVLFAEHEGEAVGFALALPDINRALTHARGRLLPFGWFRLLRAAQRIDQARVLLLGVRPEWRGRGVAALLAAAMADAGRGLGITSAELSLVQSDNRSMRTVIEGFDARRVKRFALFARELGP